jgi:hypothetical protein
MTVLAIGPHFAPLHSQFLFRQHRGLSLTQCVGVSSKLLQNLKEADLPLASPSTSEISEAADACLGYLAEHPEELLAFMQHAGLDPQALRASVGTRQLQLGLIDYFASNEPILLALCSNTGKSPESFMRTWHKLNPGG